MEHMTQLRRNFKINFLLCLLACRDGIIEIQKTDTFGSTTKNSVLYQYNTWHSELVRKVTGQQVLDGHFSISDLTSVDPVRTTY